MRLDFYKKIPIRSPFYQDVLILVTIGAIAFLLRFWQLDQFPSGLYRDEAWNGLDAWQEGFRFFYPNNNGREPLFIWLSAPFVKILGRTPLAIRIVPALAGTLTIIPLYFFSKRWLGRFVATMTITIWAISVWAIHLSRFGIRPVLFPFFISWTIWMVFIALERKKSRWWVIAGLFYGLTVLTYLTSRLVPLVAILLLLIALIQRKKPVRIRDGILFCVASAVLILPMLWSTYDQTGELLGRAGQVSILSPEINGGNLWGTLFSNLVKTFGMFFWQGDEIIRHNPAGRPVFDWMMAIPFCLGVWVIVKNGRDLRYNALLIWIGVMSIGTILAEDTPHFLRAVGMLPLLYMIPALGISWVWKHLPPSIAIGSILFLFGGSTWYTWHDYFIEYRNDPETAILFEQPARRLAEDVWTAEQYQHPIFIQKRLWDGWKSLTYLLDADLYEQYLPDYPPLPDAPLTLFAWPHQSHDRLFDAIPLPASVQIKDGVQTRGDLERESYLMYRQYDIFPSKTWHDDEIAFGSEISLYNGQLNCRENQAIVSLSWMASTPVHERLVAYVHVIHTETGQLETQSDLPPAQNLWHRWENGLLVTEQRVLQLPEACSELYEFRVGVYDSPTAEGLPILQEGISAIKLYQVLPIQ